MQSAPAFVADWINSIRSCRWSSWICVGNCYIHMIDTDYIFMITQYCFVCVKLSITGESSTGSLSISTWLQKSCSYGGKLVVMVVFVETGIYWMAGMKWFCEDMCYCWIVPWVN